MFSENKENLNLNTEKNKTDDKPARTRGRKSTQNQGAFSPFVHNILKNDKEYLALEKRKKELLVQVKKIDNEVLTLAKKTLEKEILNNYE